MSITDDDDVDNVVRFFSFVFKAFPIKNIDAVQVKKSTEQTVVLGRGQQWQKVLSQAHTASTCTSAETIAHRSRVWMATVTTFTKVKSEQDRQSHKESYPTSSSCKAQPVALHKTT